MKGASIEGVASVGYRLHGHRGRWRQVRECARRGRQQCTLTRQVRDKGLALARFDQCGLWALLLTCYVFLPPGGRRRRKRRGGGHGYGRHRRGGRPRLRGRMSRRPPCVWLEFGRRHSKRRGAWGCGRAVVGVGETGNLGRGCAGAARGMGTCAEPAWLKACGALGERGRGG